LSWPYTTAESLVVVGDLDDVAVVVGRALGVESLRRCGMSGLVDGDVIDALQAGEAVVEG
jgi:hypothetical protein